MLVQPPCAGVRHAQHPLPDADAVFVVRPHGVFDALGKVLALGRVVRLVVVGEELEGVLVVGGEEVFEVGV